MGELCADFKELADTTMNDSPRKSLREAQNRGIALFVNENCEWKLEFAESTKFIEEIVGCPVRAFANNSFGDYLFLKRKRTAADSMRRFSSSSTKGRR